MALAAPLLPEDPERLGDYWLAGRLGAGGQGVVYEAYDSTGHRVAVKVLHGEAARDRELRGRFGREATAARRVASFCTARVIDARLDGDQPYIVSEYVEGPSLRRAVRQEERRFDGDDLHRLATGVATALAAIHDAGVIHRDLKPDNVLLGPDGPRVIDFGIARTLEMSLTASGLVTGTPTYMAPEVFTGQRAGTAADVFAWGATMVFAATGKDPFDAESLGGVMHQVLSADPDLTMLAGSLRPLVAAALHKEAAARPSARDLLMALVSGFRGFQGDLLALGSAEAGLLGRADDGVPGLGVVAEEVYGGLGPAQQAVVPDVLLRMIAVDEHGDENTRRVRREELLEGRSPEERAAVERVLADLAQAGLLAGADGSITLARPALLRAWPRLRAWADEEHDGLRAHVELAAASYRWRRDGRKDADLLQGARLDAALGWAAGGRRHLALNAWEREYLDAGSALVRRHATRRRLLTLVLAALLVVSVAGGGLSVYQGRRIAEQRDQATGQQISAFAGTMRTTDPGTAMLLTVAAWRLAPGTDTRSALTTSLYQPEIAAFHDPQATGTTRRALSRDGRVLADVSADGVRLYDVRTGKRNGGWARPGIGADQFLQDVALSPTGRYLAVALSAKVVVWDTRTGKRKREYDPYADDPSKPEDRRSVVPYGLEFGDDDSTLIVHENQGLFLWNVGSGRFHGHEKWGLGHGAVASSGRLAATVAEGAEPGIHVWRLPGGTEDTRFRTSCPGTPVFLAFSPDGRTLACRGDRAVTLVDMGTARRAGEWKAAGPVNLDLTTRPELRYSPDGRLLASFADNRIQVWRVADRHLVLDYRLDGAASDVRFDSDGHSLRYLADQSVVTLDLGQRLAGGGIPGRPSVAALSQDGRLLAVRTSETGPVRLWDVRGRRFLGEPLRGSEPASDAVGSDPPKFSRDGRFLLTHDGMRAYKVWDVATRRVLRTISGKAGWHLESAALSPDGGTLVAQMSPFVIRSASQEDELWMGLWDVRSGEVRKTVRLTSSPGEYVFSPDGRYIAVGSDLGRFVDAASARPVGGSYDLSSEDGYGFGELTFAPDGRMLAMGDGMGRIAIWSTRGPTLRPPVLHGALEPVEAVSFSPDAHVLATGGGEGGVQLWDVAAGRRLGPAVDLYGSEILSLAFSRDGSALYAADGSGGVHEYPVDPGRIARQVCARVGHTLRERDWERYLSGLPYRDVCA